MKVAIVGGTGNIGTRLTKEAVSRGHHVTTVSRNPDKAHKHANVTAKKGDVTDPKALAPLLAGHDVVISAVKFSELPADNVVSATKGAGVKRLLVVGGAASLKGKDGKLVFESLPEAWRGEAGAGLKFLDKLKGEGRARLDLPVALRDDRAGRAYRHVPPRPRGASRRQGRQEPHFLRRLCASP